MFILHVFILHNSATQDANKLRLNSTQSISIISVPLGLMIKTLRAFSPPEIRKNPSPLVATAPNAWIL